MIAPGPGDTPCSDPVMLRVRRLGKTFTLHLRGGLTLPVLDRAALSLRAGECVALTGPSGAGKSTLLRTVHGNYRVGTGRVLVRHCDGWVDLATADPRTLLAVRRDTIGLVSQFLRVVPRVPTLSIVAEALTSRGVARDEAADRARAMLLRLGVSARLHGLPPATFSGGEQQRVNLARGFLGGHPILLLDEPTASLDIGNRDVVVCLIHEAKARDAAVLAIVHDPAVRDAIADRLHPVLPLQDAA